MQEAIKTASAPEPRGAYSQAVRIGGFLFVSGQLPTDRNGNLTKGTVATETFLALENVRALVEADGTFEDIAQFTIYLTWRSCPR
jgi:2-iminobutanoate/2-iminopropanoate deaminase